MADQEIGKVVHYFDKAMVAVVKLSKVVKAGDPLKFVKGDNEFELKADSIQLNHEPVSKGKKGEEIAIKVPSPTKEGATVFKVKEA
ncbi:MAG: Peptidase U32 [Candidatus Moranbacteria bacterium GW2011_GWC1_45_18]|nr:MAG: hypothetical protein UT79_C0001G0130 [Candidatus Moranbacteria bacterium GW2011_GWC2_40_12]KKT33734.1 MAG: hypothetical protein UW19_C0006G0036 [Candidatus Moranbacteria bacterium GW2011_GWF2_44_10]KKT69769.1 MAG: hypothetical protein UW66_C0062G0005 [Candidatus Moranbacteria bacterium GW2011_GWF1_44_4]KKU00088.1 MAG: Peptidase U32 [Candidatus Moranbacteria bacterium GW2011_GWC1_45_18]OGI22275.1 MAG: hypothetical protein A2194_00370 [Candidatus Moranbacteria bacterium RIFOXYA1_FULL_44_8